VSGFVGFISFDRRAIETHALGQPASTMVFRNDGSVLAVAILGAADFGPSILVLSYSATETSRLATLQKILNVGQGRITAVRYSPDDTFLAAASEDRGVYLFDVRNSYKLRGHVKSHSGGVTSVDFTLSGKFLRSFANSKDGSTIELKFFELFDNQNPPALELVEKDELTPLLKERWATASSPSATEARGVLPPVPASGEGKSVAVCSVSVDPKAKFIVAGYGDGSIRLFRYPALSLTTASVLVQGHASGPVYAAFTPDGKSICTAGSFDGTVMVWDIIAA